MNELSNDEIRIEFFFDEREKPFQIGIYIDSEGIMGYNNFTRKEAKEIADYIYDMLGLKSSQISNVADPAKLTLAQEKEVNDAWDNFQKIREKQLAKEDDLLIDILTGKRK